jgi:hypothetical protein
MIIRVFKFIHTLRIFFLCFIIVGFLYIIGLNPVSIAKFIGAKFGFAVGMSTSVPENSFNQLASQLKEKENALAQREKELKIRADELQKENDGNDFLVVALGAGIIVLFALVLLNYYLDYKRRKNEGK